MPADLRLGDWQTALADVECDALVVDAPYSERTHAAHATRHRRGGEVEPIRFDCWSPDDVAAFVAAWSQRTRGWFVTITDHVLAPHWERALEAAGRLVFSPLAYVARGSRVRLVGDGPSQWSCWVVVARPRTSDFVRWGTLDGAYVLPPGEGGHEIVGGKPLWVMRALVRDYSRPGDLVCDPCAGAATTLLAALQEGRRAVGAEVDPGRYELGRRRLARGYTAPLFVEGSAAADRAEQLDLTGTLDISIPHTRGNKWPGSR